VEHGQAVNIYEENAVALTGSQQYRQTRKNTEMTLTKRDLVMRISEETGLNQAQVFDVVQKTLNHHRIIGHRS